MAQVELIMPKMGESVAEATIIKWLKKEGDQQFLGALISWQKSDKTTTHCPHLL